MLRTQAINSSTIAASGLTWEGALRALQGQVVTVGPERFTLRAGGRVLAARSQVRPRAPAPPPPSGAAL